MFKLTTYTEKDGKKSFSFFDAPTKSLALRMAERHHRSQKWEIYTVKRVVTSCANSTDVAIIYKNCVL